MKELYDKAHNYIVNNQFIIDLIKSEGKNLKRDIIAMWISGYVRRMLEIFTGKEKFNNYYIDYNARRNLSITQVIDKRWNDFSKVEDVLVDAYKAGYDTRENE